MSVSTQADPSNAQRFQVSASYDFSSFDLLKVSSLVPVPVRNRYHGVRRQRRLLLILACTSAVLRSALTNLKSLAIREEF